MSGHVRVGPHRWDVRVRGGVVHVGTTPVVLQDIADDGSQVAVVEGRSYHVRVQRYSDDQAELLVDGVHVTAVVEGRRGIGSGTGKGLGGAVRAVLPGTIVEVRVVPGQRVETGQVLVVLEAMKMQNEVTSPFQGTVRTVGVSTGEAVETGRLLVELVPLTAGAQC